MRRLVAVLATLVVLVGAAQAYAGDIDGDGIPDELDTDDDGDGVLDAMDPLPVDPTVPSPPLADANGPYNILAGDDLDLDGSGSYDLDIEPYGDTLSYVWTVGPSEFIGMSPTVTYDSFSALGNNFEVQLIVTDIWDLNGLDTAWVHVVPEPSTLILLSMAALALLAYAWRRRPKA